MKETSFIRRYKDKWKDLEDYLQKTGKTDPDYLSSLYVQLTDDLSYAKTHYPDSKVTIYLNQLSSKLHAEIYKNKKERNSRFITFWTEELPLTIYRQRKLVLISFIGLLISFSIGWISSQNDDGFVRLVMGDAYVDATEKRMDEGDPLGIYGEDNAINMFFYITMNNIKVSVIFFVFGIFVGIGSLYAVIKNGVMLGAFIFMFFERSTETGLIALSTIWMHGTIEITEMVFAGAAGMALGGSFIFTGTYTRGESIKRGAIEGLKILFGMMPFIVVAGFIESFLTRYHANLLLSSAVILLSLGIVLSYFVIYPFVLGTRLKRVNMEGFQYGYQYPEYKITLVVGALWLVGGIAATIITLRAGEGIGILFYGAIVTGMVKIIQGLIAWSKTKKRIVA